MKKKIKLPKLNIKEIRPDDLVATSWDKKEMKRDAENLVWEAENDTESLGFFWGTLAPKDPKEPEYDERTQEVYDKTILKIQKRFAKTIMALSKENKGSKLWRRMIVNAQMHINWKDKK